MDGMFQRWLRDGLGDFFEAVRRGQIIFALSPGMLSKSIKDVGGHKGQGFNRFRMGVGSVPSCSR